MPWNEKIAPPRFCSCNLKVGRERERVNKKIDATQDNDLNSKLKTLFERDTSSISVMENYRLIKENFKIKVENTNLEKDRKALLIERQELLKKIKDYEK